jgi:hypothetical protein
MTQRKVRRDEYRAGQKFGQDKALPGGTIAAKKISSGTIDAGAQVREENVVISLP